MPVPPTGTPEKSKSANPGRAREGGGKSNRERERWRLGGEGGINRLHWSGLPMNTIFHPTLGTRISKHALAIRPTNHAPGNSIAVVTGPSTTAVTWPSSSSSSSPPPSSSGRVSAGETTTVPGSPVRSSTNMLSMGWLGWRIRWWMVTSIDHTHSHPH